MKTFKGILIGIFGVVAIIIAVIFGVQSNQNKAFGLEEAVESARSDISLQEKRRADLVYNLADAVKEYDKHEYDTLVAIVDGRNTGETDTQNAYTVISAVAEQYPDLKSSDNYKQLMTELATTENLIAEYRSNYNKRVKDYNRYIRKFPTRVFLDWLGYEKQDYSYLNFDVSEDAPQDLFE